MSRMSELETSSRIYLNWLGELSERTAKLEEANRKAGGKPASASHIAFIENDLREMMAAMRKEIEGLQEKDDAEKVGDRLTAQVDVSIYPDMAKALADIIINLDMIRYKMDSIDRRLHALERPHDEGQHRISVTYTFPETLGSGTDNTKWSYVAP